MTSTKPSTMTSTEPSTKKLQGNLPLRLNDPNVIWIVQQGAIALFAVTTVNGTPEGERRYLFDVSPGEALFCITSNYPALNDRPESLSVIAIAVEPSELVEQAVADLTVPDLILLIEPWLHRLAQVEGLPKPDFTSAIAIDRFISLDPHQIFQPPAATVLWLQGQTGVVQWYGLDSITLTAESDLLPLATGMWISATHPAQFTIHSLDQFQSTDRLLKGLNQVHHFFLRSIEQIAAQEIQTDFSRFQSRQKIRRLVTQTALQDLVSLLRPRPADQFSNGDQLLMVAGAVGRAMGVAMEPPLEAEDPTRMKNPLEAIAYASQLRLRRIVLRDNWWQKDGGPIVAFTQEGQHPVALLPVAGNHYELFDPQAAESATRLGFNRKPRHPVVDATLAARLNPSAYIFYRPFSTLVPRAWDMVKFAFKGQSRNLLLMLGMGAAVTLIGMLLPLATGVLIDRALPMGDRQLLLQISLGLLFFAIGSVGLQWVQSIASMRLETLSESSMQAAVWDRLLRLQPDFFRQYTIGDLDSRVSSISQIRSKLTGSTLQTLLTSFFALLNFGLMFAYSPQLALVAGLVAGVAIAFIAIAGTLLLRLTRPLLEIRSDIYGLLIKLIEAVPKLRSAGAEERAFATWGKKYTQQLKLESKTQLIQDSAKVFNTVLPGITSTLLFWTTVILLGKAQAAGTTSLSTGQFLAFTAAYGIFIGGATSLSNTIITVLDVVTLWRRSQPILTAAPEVDPTKADPGRLAGRVVVDRVTFRYRPEGALILDQVSLYAEPGEFIALVGSSGSGKSTLMRLLLGFNAASEGTVYYDGQDLASLDITAVRRQLGVVLQNGRINAGSIYENIAASTLLPVSSAWEAAEMAGFADDVRAMPMGMYTFVSEGGGNISGGQRQRLMIARALALKPKILLFDEATSALDNRTQAIVTESLDSFGVTRIVIAHRLSTIRNADRIYVIEAGRVVQQGSFEALAHEEGVFAQLIARQWGNSP
jgi:NHLM bacteriocin system ABC transporter ATP-binding protein